MNRALSILFASIFLWNCSGSTTPTDGGTVLCPTGAGTSHGTTITASETWKASDGPHTVTADVKVASGATLTIEPCAEVRLKKDTNLIAEGNVLAEGSATAPIIFAAADAEPWGSLRVFAPGTLKLAFATVSGGGAPSATNFGMIDARGDQLLPSQEVLKLDTVAVTGSGSFGVSLRDGAAFTTTSREVTISGSKKAPMRILPRLATNLPTGKYTGNTEDAILVETEAYGGVNYENVTFRNRGVPYRVGEITLGDLNVGPKDFTLTIEPGVTLAFKKAGILAALSSNTPASTGVLVAAGSATQPVIFTSSAAVPAAGDWRGIVLGSRFATSFKLDHVQIRYAGGPSMASGFHCHPNPTVAGEVSKDEDAALAIFFQPATSFLTNSTIADSKAVAVNLAYTGTFVDFVPTNTFTNNASCKVTYPKPATGLCPSTGLCP